MYEFFSEHPRKLGWLSELPGSQLTDHRSNPSSLLDLGEEFEIMQKGFLSEHCSVFNNCEENQLYHTDIFNNYVSN